jgi:DoxX-like family
MNVMTLAESNGIAEAARPGVEGISRGRKLVSRRTGAMLWTAQVLLALLFLFAGGVKLAMPVNVLAQQAGLPGPFLHFVAVAELLGALGLVLPGVLRVGRGLTPLAAAGLVAIMSGAATLSFVRIGMAAGAFPVVVGIVLATIVHGRRDWAPQRLGSS